ncbi:hypothetical protein L7F22_044718 [Adiantum nelumboides]|nr:hypothetical protein [Adiantum nelumboides]
MDALKRAICTSSTERAVAFYTSKTRAFSYYTALWRAPCPRHRRLYFRQHCSHHFFPTVAGSDGALAASEVDTTSACIEPASAIDFLMLCQRLKATKRTGWVNHGLKDTESIADHMHRMAVMAIIAAGIPDINRDKCVKMAVVHDIAEAIVGDITPSCGISKEEKSRRERAAIDEMCKLLGGGLAAEEVKELWLDYENNASVEANLVKDFDKVIQAIQTLDYIRVKLCS